MTEHDTPSTARTEAGAYKPEAWRMRDYYPDSYAKSMAALGIGIDYDDGDYDRLHAEFLADLAARDAELRAEVLAQVREGLEASRTYRFAVFGAYFLVVSKADALAVVDRLGGKP